MSRTQAIARTAMIILMGAMLASGLSLMLTDLTGARTGLDQRDSVTSALVLYLS